MVKTFEYVRFDKDMNYIEASTRKYKQLIIDLRCPLPADP